tara:strand:- start:3141 stop:3470 length:330 start_codon:yes stop_codon:yes gene_type:complete
MSANPSQKETWFAGFTSSSFYGRNKAEPGKYIGARVIPASAGSVDLDGQGYGAIIVGDPTNLFVTASNGVVIPTAQLGTNTIVEIGLKGVKVGATGNCTVFKLNNAKGS